MLCSIPHIGDIVYIVYAKKGPKKVEVKSVDETQVELRVGRLLCAKQGGAKDVVNIADVGFGVSQTLPILVALEGAHHFSLLTAREQIMYSLGYGF